MEPLTQPHGKRAVSECQVIKFNDATTFNLRVEQGLAYLPDQDECPQHHGAAGGAGGASQGPADELGGPLLPPAAPLLPPALPPPPVLVGSRRSGSRGPVAICAAAPRLQVWRRRRAGPPARPRPLVPTCLPPGGLPSRQWCVQTRKSLRKRGLSAQIFFASPARLAAGGGLARPPPAPPTHPPTQPRSLTSGGC